MRPDIIQKLSAIVGIDNLYTSLEDLYCYTYDASFVKADLKKDLAGVAVYPGNTEEVSQILKLANQERIPVVPRGAGSNVSGGTISVGDCILHATILTDEMDLEEAARVEKAIDEIFVATVELGGSLSGEHGIGRAKSKFITLQTGEVGLEVQHRIKQALDPNNILNPGVMFGA